MKRSNILLATAVTGTLIAGPAFAWSHRSEANPPQVKSSNLKAAQQKLNDEGYNVGRADGKWGTKTAQAVKSFQKDNNIPVTGKLDQQTLADLGIGAQSTTGRSVSPNQSTGPNRNYNSNYGGQQNTSPQQNRMQQGGGKM